MSADGSIEIVWAGEDRRFRIGIGEYRSLQESVNARRVLINAEPIGPSALLHLLRTNNAWPDDVRDVLKAGLVGGGLTFQEANKLLVRHFDGKPLIEHVKTAFPILLASLVGVPDDEPSKKKTEVTMEEKMDQSNSPSSTETVLQ
jgi:hypothetical protein